MTSSGMKLWARAKRKIPGGTQLLSKRPEMFLPDQWPTYYQRAKGAEIWDLDGNHFYDLSTMGVGTCILGYADDDVNQAVKKAIDLGSMATLNCYEDVELAELLLDLHTWARKVRFARTGGEAMAVAVRIARAFTKKDQVAFCGYHGWHDWYVCANLANGRNLDGQLLPGLAPAGISRGLKGTAIPFNYNNEIELQEIVRNHEVGVIVLEPIRHQIPKGNFLKNVRKIATDIGAVLIFDEITSGWRMNIGGVHSLYGVQPDIVVYGKAMSNGFPMAAIVGRGDVLDAAEDTFISSTYWTERIGPTASLATIGKMRELDVPAHLCSVGDRIGSAWRKLANEHELEISVVGIPPLITFKFDDDADAQALMTLFTQEMLKRGFLASKSVYVSYSHTYELISSYLENVDEVFGIVKRSIDMHTTEKLLDGPVAHEGFKRLTWPLT